MKCQDLFSLEKTSTCHLLQLLLAPKVNIVRGCTEAICLFIGIFGEQLFEFLGAGRGGTWEVGTNFALTLYIMTL